MGVRSIIALSMVIEDQCHVEQYLPVGFIRHSAFAQLHGAAFLLTQDSGSFNLEDSVHRKACSPASFSPTPESETEMLYGPDRAEDAWGGVTPMVNRAFPDLPISTIGYYARLMHPPESIGQRVAYLEL